MTRTISLITAIAGLALVTAVPALGKGTAVPQDFWNYDQQGQQIANTSPGLRAQDLASQYASLGVDESPIASPDAVDRALAAKLAQQAAQASDGQRLSFDNYRVQTGETSAGRSLVFDNHRIDPVGSPTQVTVSDSGRDLEWPQIGVAFGIGIALMLGLYLTLRLARVRPLAH
jgi:hypothetical protein